MQSPTAMIFIRSAPELYSVDILQEQQETIPNITVQYRTDQGWQIQSFVAVPWSYIRGSLMVLFRLELTTEMFLFVHYGNPVYSQVGPWDYTDSAFEDFPTESES